MCPAYYNTGRSQLWVKGLVKRGLGPTKAPPSGAAETPIPYFPRPRVRPGCARRRSHSRSPARSHRHIPTAPAYCALTLSLSPSRGPLSYRSVPRPGAAVAVLCVELEGHGLFQAERQTLRLERHLRACVPRRLVVLHARVCVCATRRKVSVVRVRSGACPWAQREPKRLLPPLRPLIPTRLAQNGQTAWASLTELHGKAPDRSRDGAPARPQDGVSTQDAQHVDTHTTERPGGTRTEIERTRHSPHLCAAPAPGSTRSRLTHTRTCAWTNPWILDGHALGTTRQYRNNCPRARTRLY